MTDTTTPEDPALTAIREQIQAAGSFKMETVRTFGGALGLKVFTKVSEFQTAPERWQKLPVILFPGDDEKFPDLLRTLAAMIEDGQK